ncbi:MAG: DUF4924 family protein [Bacteroidota bacterium]|nr:DUF4924 domain-containing protein [Odoribacter sp.]MDP3643601.1 DUF4924 family protein [Bacteroidota bacterium]
MLIARELRKTNIAEYILYMWQVEDLLRACSFDPETIEQQLVFRFKADENTNKEIAAWYNNLAVMMEKEHVQEKGHIQVIVNLVNDLNEFHLKMLEVQKDQEYIRLYRLNRDAISDFIKRSEITVENEAEACLNALYGLMILKLKNSEISPVTQKTCEGFASMIGHLSARYIQFENDDFEF